MSSDSKPELLCRVDFPLYCVNVFSPRHLIVGGGGGAAKTGVKNGFEIFELSHDGRQTKAESVTRYESGDFACMNMCVAGYEQKAPQTNYVAVGHNDKCQIYKLNMKREKVAQSASGNGDVKNSSRNGGVTPTKLVFNVTPMKSIQTDFNLPEPYQKVCRLSPNNSYLATAGDDGLLRVWTFAPNHDLYRTHEIEAHEKEIDDLDFSPDSSKIVTISKDRRAFVWDVKKGKKHAEMGWDPKGGKVKYMFKRVRFGKVEGSIKNSKVFTISNPIGASKPPSYLQRWDGKNFQLEQSHSFDGSLSALAVSDNGNFVATGSMFTGTVEIFIAFNLQRVKRVEKSHATFITGLEFLSCSESSDVVRGFSDCSVVSISVDHQVCIHHVPKQRQISMLMAFWILAIVLILVFCLCSYLGL